MGPGAMTHMPGLMKFGSGIQKLIEGDSQTHTETAWRSHKPTLGKWTKNGKRW
jgi:hypothetical protein